MANGNSSKRALTRSPERPIRGSVPLPLPNLPDEIIAEIILPRLPVKSLLKFRCVSKSWRSVISSPEFMKTHLAISTKNNINCHNRLIVGSGRPLPMIFHTFLLNPKIGNECNSSVDTLVLDCDSHGSLRIVGSCNGLVCVVLGDCNLVLWNPATRKSKKLPCSDVNGYWMEYGFGYDASKDDYKVVEVCCVFSDEEEHETKVKVYSWRDDLWRDIDWTGGIMSDGAGVFVNGAIHWKVHNGAPSNWEVIALDVMMETFSSVQPPRRGSEDVASVMLGVVSGGCLCVSYDYDSYMDVWVMREYGMRESWTKLVCASYYFCTRHRDLVRPKMLFVSENGGILFGLGSDLILYKLPNCHEVHRLGHGAEVEGVTFSESLVSP